MKEGSTVLNIDKIALTDNNHEPSLSFQKSRFNRNDPSGDTRSIGSQLQICNYAGAIAKTNTKKELKKR